MTQSYQSREVDELELQYGDLICVTDEAIENSKDGWVEGLSHLTGCTGIFPLSYTVRVPESETWTLHRSVQICRPGTSTGDEQLKAHNGDELQKRSPSYDSKRSDWKLAGDCQPPDLTPNRLQEVNTSNPHDFYRKFIIWDPSVGKFVQEPNANQKLFIMRHGERVDFTFSKWVMNCFDADGIYRRLDLNMPKQLPERANPSTAWRNDSPLTNIGVYQAKLIGEMLHEVGIRIDYVYSSPAYRCLQTTRAVLEGMQVHNQIQIRIEPALFEWCGWYPERVPEFLTASELLAVGFNIDVDYMPLVTTAELEMRYKNETLTEFYERNNLVSEHVTKLTSENILLVGHAANIETNSRLLAGGKCRTMAEVAKLMSKVPYASLLAMEKVNNSQWKVVAPNVYPISHTRNFHFDWREFADDQDINSSSSQQSLV